MRTKDRGAEGVFGLPQRGITGFYPKSVPIEPSEGGSVACHAHSSH